MSRWLFAFDLDGTLLHSDKSLSPANQRALQEMAAAGAVVTLASGRLGSSVSQYSGQLGFEPSLLTLNGAAVYLRTSEGHRPVYSVLMEQAYVDELVAYAHDKDFACNVYSGGSLISMRNGRTAAWIDFYYGQTRTRYEYVDDIRTLRGRPAFKMLYVGGRETIDAEEARFRRRWDGSLYIVRTCDNYLEFMSPQADKGKGLDALARAAGVDGSRVVAFGDADNDIPLLKHAGLGIAMHNASPATKAAAARVSAWTNDEDAVAREWDLLKPRVLG